MNRRESKTECPHCGGRDLEDNGLRRNHPDFTLLCVTRVTEDEASVDYRTAGNPEYDADGKVICGHQWTPNDGDE